VECLASSFAQMYRWTLASVDLVKIHVLAQIPACLVFAHQLPIHRFAMMAYQTVASPEPLFVWTSYPIPRTAETATYHVALMTSVLLEHVSLSLLIQVRLVGLERL